MSIYSKMIARLGRCARAMKFHYIYFSRMRKARKRVTKAYIENLARGSDVPEYWVDDRAKVVYVVNAKAACSSIQSALYRYAVGRQPPKDIHAAPETRHFRRSSLTKNQREEYFVFTFVRNPIDRVSSCYKNKFSDIRDNRKAEFEFNNYLAGLLKRKDSFYEFVEKLKIIPAKYCDRHFAPQHYWIYEKCGVHPDFIGRVEQMEQDWQKVKRRLPGLPDVDTINLSKPANIDLDEKSKSVLKKKYKEDFRLFGYNFE